MRFAGANQGKPATVRPDAPASTLTRRDALRLLGLGAAVPALSTACGGSVRPPPTYAATIASARAAIARLLAEGRAASLSVALVDGERVLWAEAAGSLDLARGLAPTAQTLYGAAASKLVAAVATMVLVDRGLVELDAPLVRYLPGFRMADAQASAITVRMLLDNSSGLPGSDARGASTVAPVAGYAAAVQQALAGQRLKHAPGELAVACNDGFTLVELLVAAAAGKPYAEFVAAEVLAPLGMAKSRFGLEALAPGSFAPALDGAGRPLPQEHLNAYAASGLWAAPAELGRLAMMLLNGGSLEGRRLLSERAVAEMGKDQTAHLPLNPITAHGYHFGLGWDGVRQGGLSAAFVTAWHAGGASAFYGSALLAAPDERLAVVVCRADGDAPAGVLAEGILLEALAECGSIVEVPAPLQPAPAPAARSSDAELAAASGIYAGRDGLWRLSAQADRTLVLSRLAGGQWAPVLPGLQERQDSRYVAAAQPGLSFRCAQVGGRRYLAARQPAGNGHYAEELPLGHDLPAAPPLSARWQARVGRRWLAANDAYGSALSLGAAPWLQLETVPDLQGYLVATAPSLDRVLQVVAPGAGDDRALMCLKVPVLQGRDLGDVVVEARGAEEWLRWGSTLFRPLETVPALAASQGAVAIGSAGLGEWQRLPAARTLTLTGARSWFLYDAALTLLASGVGDGATGAVPAGAFLLVHGAPGATVKLAAADG